MNATPLIPHINNETSPLRTVVVGLPHSQGRVPLLSECYDAKSYDSVLQGIYPTEQATITAMDALVQTLLRNGIEVLRPEPLEDCNQVFARDICFVIDDTLFLSNMIPDREQETTALGNILSRIEKQHIEVLPQQVHAEGGDIILCEDALFVGCYFGEDYPSYKTARTNRYAVDFLRERFPRKEIIPLELKKHDRDPRQGVLHLDCAFQPVGKGKALLYPDGLLHQKDLGLLREFFGRENIFEVDTEELYHMNTNVFSLAPDKVISDAHFVRLNQYLREQWGIMVEEVHYQEVGKMGGLLRCSTMPLVRA